MQFVVEERLCRRHPDCGTALSLLRPQHGCCAHDPCGLQIHFRQPPDAADLAHYHFEDVRIESPGTAQERYINCGSTGYVMHVTGHGATVEAARQAALRRIDNIVIPRMYYRADIGESFIHATQSQLQQLGCL